MEYKEQFSKRLVQLREKRGITQQELADKLEITRQSLSLYEKAERTINIELLAKIADFFNVSTDYLMGRTDVSSMNKDIQVACDVTGLSEDLVLELAKLKGVAKYEYGFELFSNLLLYKSSGWSYSSYLELLLSNLTSCLNAKLKVRHRTESNKPCTDEQKNEYRLAVNVLKKYNMETSSIVEHSLMAKWFLCKNFEHAVETVINFKLLDFEPNPIKDEKYKELIELYKEASDNAHNKKEG